MRVMFSCDGQWSGERCRAFLPVPADYLRGGLIDPDAAVNRAFEQGWTQTPARDLCPSCTHVAQLVAAAHTPIPSRIDRRPW